VSAERVVPSERARKLLEKLDGEAERSGYHLNPDRDFTLGLVEGLIVNESRYGYPSCPCRLASGVEEEDLDIVCPCDYRDPDLTEWGACYCALYVSEDVLGGGRKLSPVPERRPPADERRARSGGKGGEAGFAFPVWRCRVCGYLCARDEPPDVCPICHAKRERFERFA
jgi:ferredoxin-thioredoxin reductase catalytic chain